MKQHRLTVSVFVLFACVFSSTPSHSGKLLMMIPPLLAKKTPSYGDMNTMVKLISVSSDSSNSLTADWLPSQDIQTPASQIRYTFHVSTVENFLPSAATAKGTVVGKETLTVTGLQANTQYFVLIAAADGSGNTSWSNRLAARTVATAAVRTSAVLAAQAQSQNPAVTPTTVTYSASQAPAAGSYIASSVGSGYLRKVVSASAANGVVTAQTAAASLNEVLQQYEISTVIKFAKVPASSPAPAMAQALTAGASLSSVRQHNWTESGLTLTDSNQESADGKLVSTATGKLVAADSSDIESQTVTGEYSDMTGPKYLAGSIGTTLNATVQVQLNSEGQKESQTICKILLEDFTHDDSNLAKLSPPTSSQSIPSDKKSGSLKLSLTPTDSYIDSKDRPYEVTVTAYLNNEGCDNVFFWDDKVEMKIPIYIERGRFEINYEKKTVPFSGDFNVTNEAVMNFEPDLKIDVKAPNGSLQSADFIVNANIKLSNTLNINATKAGNLSQTLPLLSKRKFFKVFLVGGVPVVMRGEFSMDARIDGQVSGAIGLTKFLELSFPDTKFGMQYRIVNGVGVWKSVTNFNPKQTFHIYGTADANAEITLTLIPDLQIHCYEAISGRMILKPSLYAKAGLHGQFSYLSDSDYWFTYLDAGVALDMLLYANLHVLHYNIASWPTNVSPDETSKFAPFQLITQEQGKMYALPTLSGSADYQPQTPPDSRAILISGTAADYVTPLFGWKLNPFRAWTEPKVITDRQYAITPLDESRVKHWFIPKQAGDFTVRLGGYSKLGWFVRQVTEVPLSLPDADADGLPDYWESRFGITNAVSDNDGDGLSNAAEFSRGTKPNSADSDGGGRSDGQEIADGTNPLDGSDDLVQIRRVPLNDTGITWSGNYASGNNTVCVASTTPDGDNVVAAQDCSHGRDVTHNDDSDGHAGFSYTKLNSNGQPLANQNADYATMPWACVKDNVTGLIWEVKTDDGGLHDKDDTYTWYNTDPKTNGGADGSADDGGNTCYGYDSSNAATFCNTQAYVNRVNAAGWCGASDWRMPTRKELESLVHRGRSDMAIDISYFPNTISNWHLSGSPYADDYSDKAWCINFNSDNSFSYPGARDNSSVVRLVRGGK